MITDTTKHTVKNGCFATSANQLKFSKCISSSLDDLISQYLLKMYCNIIDTLYYP